MYIHGLKQKECTKHDSQVHQLIQAMLPAGRVGYCSSMLSETWVGLTSPEHHSIYKTCIMYIYIYYHLIWTRKCIFEYFGSIWRNTRAGSCLKHLPLHVSSGLVFLCVCVRVTNPESILGSPLSVFSVWTHSLNSFSCQERYRYRFVLISSGRLWSFQIYWSQTPT